MEWRHPDGWRIDDVVLTRDGPPRQFLRLRWRSYLIGYYGSADELAKELTTRGHDLADFTEHPDATPPTEAP